MMSDVYVFVFYGIITLLDHLVINTHFVAAISNIVK